MAQDVMTGLQNVGQFLQSPQMPVLAGQVGAAAMGPNQNTWQAMLGKVAANYGQSAIAAGEAQAQGNKSPAMNNWLKMILPAMMGGVNLTPEGQAGPTDATIKINADGTFSTTTKGNTVNQGGNAPAGATNPGQMDPKASQPMQPTQPSQPAAGGGFNPRMLPFLMALSGNASGGANTNLTGLSPEQITAISNSNVAGGKLGQDSIQNIFENVSKMAYSDYLDRLPQDKLPKDPNAKLVEGGDGFYWEHNPVTGAIRKTDIPVAQKKLQYGPGGSGGALPFQALPTLDIDPNSPTYGQLVYVQFNRGAGGVQPLKTPEGGGVAPPKEVLQREKETTKVTANEAAELQRLDSILGGSYKDPKTKQAVKPSTSHTDRYNALSTNPEAVFVKKVPGRVLGNLSPTETVVRVPIPNGVPARDAYKQYRFFVGEGGRGSFEDFIANPKVMISVATAMEKKK